MVDGVDVGDGRGRQRPGQPVPGAGEAVHHRRDFGGWDAVNDKFFDEEHRHRDRDPAGQPGKHGRVDRRRPSRPAGAAAGARRSSRRDAGSLTRRLGLGLGVAMLWFSLLVLHPADRRGGHGHARAAGAGSGTRSPAPQTAAAIRLTVGQRSWSRAVNVVMGTLIAWVLVRDQFPGKRLLEVAHRHPVRPADDRRRPGAAVALRAGQPARRQRGQHPLGGVPRLPVRDAAVRRAHGAAGAAGAGARGGGGGRVARREPLTIFRRIILPSLAPAIAAGAALSFARAISEYGSLVLLSGNLPYSTEVASVRILS